MEELKKNLSKEQNVFKMVLTQSQSAVHARYAISHVIAKIMRPFSGDFVKNCLLQASDILCPKKRQCFADVSLSRNTVVERASDMTDDLTNRLKQRANTFKYFSFAADENTDISDHAQIMFFIRGVDEDLIVTVELAQVEGLLETTRGQDIY